MACVNDQSVSCQTLDHDHSAPDIIGEMSKESSVDVEAKVDSSEIGVTTEKIVETNSNTNCPTESGRTLSRRARRRVCKIY